MIFGGEFYFKFIQFSRMAIETIGKRLPHKIHLQGHFVTVALRAAAGDDDRAPINM